MLIILFLFCSVYSQQRMTSFSSQPLQTDFWPVCRTSTFNSWARVRLSPLVLSRKDPVYQPQMTDERNRENWQGNGNSRRNPPHCHCIRYKSLMSGSAIAYPPVLWHGPSLYRNVAQEYVHCCCNAPCNTCCCAACDQNSQRISMFRPHHPFQALTLTYA